VGGLELRGADKQKEGGRGGGGGGGFLHGNK
jgi:hypothetical protein